MFKTEIKITLKRSDRGNSYNSPEKVWKEEILMNKKSFP